MVTHRSDTQYSLSSFVTKRLSPILSPMSGKVSACYIFDFLPSSLSNWIPQYSGHMDLSTFLRSVSPVSRDLMCAYIRVCVDLKFIDEPGGI
jgi:hypothetical protein